MIELESVNQKYSVDDTQIVMRNLDLKISQEGKTTFELSVCEELS